MRSTYPSLELIGLPGTGKTTIGGELAANSPELTYCFADPRHERPWEYFRCWLRGYPWLFAHGHSSSARKHLRERARVDALHELVVRCRHRRGTGVLFDQGPLFSLARAPLFRGTPWWRDALRRWAETLDLVVRLDAPDEMLVARVRQRPKSHCVAVLTTAEARRYLHDHRRRHDELLHDLARPGRVAYLTIDTSRTDVRSAVASIRHACGLDVTLPAAADAA